MIPKTGNKTTGKSAVTASGVASVIHQIAIQIAIPAILLVAGLNESNSKNRITPNPNSGPASNPKIRADNIFLIKIYLSFARCEI